MRYKKICDWLERSFINEAHLAAEEFTLDEIQFIADFSKTRIIQEKPELIKYFKELL